MNSFFAMAGPAEAAFAQSLIIAWAGLSVIGGLIIVSWFRRSWRIGVAAIIAALLAGIYLGPIAVLFGPEKNPHSLSDPDYIYWLGQFRNMAVVWVITAAATITLIPLIRKYPKNPRPPASKTAAFTTGHQTI